MRAFRVANVGGVLALLFFLVGVPDSKDVAVRERTLHSGGGMRIDGSDELSLCQSVGDVAEVRNKDSEGLSSSAWETPLGVEHCCESYIFDNGSISTNPQIGVVTVDPRLGVRCQDFGFQNRETGGCTRLVGTWTCSCGNGASVTVRS